MLEKIENLRNMDKEKKIIVISLIAVLLFMIIILFGVKVEDSNNMNVEVNNPYISAANDTVVKALHVPLTDVYDSNGNLLYKEAKNLKPGSSILTYDKVEADGSSIRHVDKTVYVPLSPNYADDCTFTWDIRVPNNIKVGENLAKDATLFQYFPHGDENAFIAKVWIDQDEREYFDKNLDKEFIFTLSNPNDKLKGKIIVPMAKSSFMVDKKRKYVVAFKIDNDVNGKQLNYIPITLKINLESGKISLFRKIIKNIKN